MQGGVPVVEFSVPALVAEPTSGNASSTVVRHAAEHPELVLFSRREADRWVDVTAAEFAAQVDELARGLLAAGIAAGDRVALMSKTRYEWTLVDYAIWSVAAVTVPIYETSSTEQVQWILSDS